MAAEAAEGGCARLGRLEQPQGRPQDVDGHGRGVHPSTGVIEDAKFKTYGCGSAIASSSLVTEWVRGRTLDEALAIKNSQIAEELALPPVKIHCSILAEDAIKAAVADFRSRQATGEAATLVSEQPACASSTR